MEQDLVAKVSRAVVIANKTQTAADVINVVGENLDVDLPWKKREDNEDEIVVPSPKQRKSKMQEPSNRVRNFIVGGGIGALFLLLVRKGRTVPPTKTADVQLTPSFRLSEFLVSKDVPEIKTYQPTLGEMLNVRRVANILQKIRDSYGKPIIINSGGRPLSLVVARGKYAGKSIAQILIEKGYQPAAHSQHADFSAADFTVAAKKDLPAIFQRIVRLTSDPVIGATITQAILYIDDGIPNFIHLGVVSSVQKFAITKPLLLAITQTSGKEKRELKYLTYSPDVLTANLA